MNTKKFLIAALAALLAFTSADAVIKSPPAGGSSGSVACSALPALTGDITTSAGACATTLATVNSNVGSFTSANITVNAKGVITAAANGGSGQVVSSFTGTLTGMTTVVTGTVNTYTSGQQVWLYAQFTGTSNTTSMTMTGLPSGLQPVSLDQLVPVVVTNAGVSSTLGCALVAHASGTIIFYAGTTAGTCVSSSFTGSGVKGFSTAGQGTLISYILN